MKITEENMIVLEGAVHYISTVREFVEIDRFGDDNIYPLDSFRYNKELISDLLRELRASIENLQAYL